MHEVKDMTTIEVQEAIEQLLKSCPRLTFVRTSGIEFSLYKWLDDMTDFFSAPASTRFHLSEKGGLARHSLNVYLRLKDYAFQNKINCTGESLIICALLHDLCKTGYYKNSNDRYIIDDQFPMNHGHKSAYLIANLGIHLQDCESLAIAHHMGAWHCKGIYEFEQALSKAYHGHKLVLALHHSDEQSTFWDKL